MTIRFPTYRGWYGPTSLLANLGKILLRLSLISIATCMAVLGICYLILVFIGAITGNGWETALVALLTQLFILVSVALIPVRSA